MSIPTAHDARLSEISDTAAGILQQLRTMQHAANRDLPGMRKRLRQQLQNFADSVMLAARDT